MTISTDIIKNPTALSLRVNKAVVDYIRRNRMVDGRPATIKTSELLHVAYNCVGIADQILADYLFYKIVNLIHERRCV